MQFDRNFLFRIAAKFLWQLPAFTLHLNRMTRSAHMIVVYGGAGVGKSALTIRLVLNHFLDEYDPTIEDSYRKQLEVDDETCVVDVLDTAGREEFSAVRDHYTRVGDGFLLVYSITERATFFEVDTIRNRIVQMKGNSQVPPMIIVANKCDLESTRKVQRAEGQEYAELNGMRFFETSAKRMINVQEVFAELVRQIRRFSAQPNPEPRKFCTLL